MEDSSIHEQSAAYALHALPADEALAFEEHLRACTVCMAELGSLRSAAAALAYAAGEESPSPKLRGRVLMQVRARPSRAPRLRLQRWTIPAVATAAAAAAIALALWAASLDHSLARERTARTADAQTLAVLASPEARRYPLIGERGMLAVAPGGRAVLVVSRLDSAPGGKSYEAWVVTGGEPQAAGVFEGGGRSTVVLTRRVPRGARVLVSMERAGGVPRLTGMVLFGAETA